MGIKKKVGYYMLACGCFNKETDGCMICSYSNKSYGRCSNLSRQHTSKPHQEGRRTKALLSQAIVEENPDLFTQKPNFWHPRST
jgi:hypothetical protein